jgi:hypothetical protein
LLEKRIWLRLEAAAWASRWSATKESRRSNFGVFISSRLSAGQWVII